MTDGPSLKLTQDDRIVYATGQTLLDFAICIENQPIEAIAGFLELVGNELYRRGMWIAGNDVKDVVRALRGMS